MDVVGGGARPPEVSDAARHLSMAKAAVALANMFCASAGVAMSSTTAMSCSIGRRSNGGVDCRLLQREVLQLEPAAVEISPLIKSSGDMAASLPKAIASLIAEIHVSDSAWDSHTNSK